MIERLKELFQNKHSLEPGSAPESERYHKGDIVYYSDHHNGTQKGKIVKVKQTDTPIQIVTLEIIRNYDNRGETIGNSSRTRLQIPSTSGYLLRIQEAAPSQGRLPTWLRRR